MRLARQAKHRGARCAVLGLAFDRQVGCASACSIRLSTIICTTSWMFLKVLFTTKRHTGTRVGVVIQCRLEV